MKCNFRITERGATITFRDVPMAEAKVAVSVAGQKREALAKVEELLPLAVCELIYGQAEARPEPGPDDGAAEAGLEITEKG